MDAMNWVCKLVHTCNNSNRLTTGRYIVEQYVYDYNLSYRSNGYFGLLDQFIDDKEQNLIIYKSYTQYYNNHDVRTAFVLLDSCGKYKVGDIVFITNEQNN